MRVPIDIQSLLRSCLNSVWLLHLDPVPALEHSV